MLLYARCRLMGIFKRHDDYALFGYVLQHTSPVTGRFSFYNHQLTNPRRIRPFARVHISHASLRHDDPRRVSYTPARPRRARPVPSSRLSANIVGVGYQIVAGTAAVA